jgi:UDP-N-acetylmuramyl pentapeptide phosphotransferase/UDP-N-acetylglucosamine-1-phosphate transferase
MITLLAVAALAFALSCAGVHAMDIVLRRRDQLAPPTERGLHSSPTPAGGGLAVVVSIAICLFVMGGADLPNSNRVALLCALGLAIAGLRDDLVGLSAAVRLLLQMAAAALMMAVVPDDWRILTALPIVMERAALLVVWVGLMNAWNFMDGADGVCGVQTIMVCLGAMLCWLVLGGAAMTVIPPIAVAAATAGFLVWNWPPARIFMGDAGSVPLGFLAGFMLFDLAAHGAAAAAMILPLYFVADSGITLARRAMRGEKLWTAHREHFYQRAILAGLSHRDAALRIALAGVVTSVCAAVSIIAPWPALLGALIAVGILIRSFSGTGQSNVR